MAKRKRLISFIIFTLVLALSHDTLYAENYRVRWSILGFDDRSRLELGDDIEVETDRLAGDKNRAVMVASEVLRRELASDDPDSKVVHTLVSVTEKRGKWLVTYKWDYKSDVAIGRSTVRTFDFEVDFRKRLVTYVRSIDSRFGE